MQPGAPRQSAPSAASSWTAALLELALVFAVAPHALAQSPLSPPVRVYTGQPSNPNADMQPGELSPMQRKDYEKRLKAINADRQKSLEADTVRLLRLVQELNGELASQAGNPTPVQLRKVEQVEKLARQVKDKMSISVRSMADSGPFTADP